MPHQLDAYLIVSVAKVIDAARNTEMVNLIQAAVARQKQKALLGNNVGDRAGGRFDRPLLLSNAELQRRRLDCAWLAQMSFAI